jgi:hypothetical protein
MLPGREGGDMDEGSNGEESKPRWGFAAIAVGFLMLAWVIGTTGWGLWGANRSCPNDFVAGPPGASAWVYAAEGSIELGRPACLYLKPDVFFRAERAAVDPKQKPSGAAGLAQPPQWRKVFLFLDDVKVPIDGRPVDILSGTPERPWVLVDMLLGGTEDAASEDGRTWRKILGGPTEMGARQVRIHVAVEEASDKPPVVRAKLGPRATLQVFDFWRLILGGFGLALLAAGIVKRGWNTGLLRDGGPKSPFSLGRVQMGWWLVLTVGGFLFIWLASGQWKGVVTSGVVTLLGISASTGVMARLVDTRGSLSSPPGHWDSPPSGMKSSFLADIVNDGDGAGLHRIQLIAWTLLLGAVFLWTVVWTFEFPNFDTNLLLLTGIAGGTYLGFKLQEDSPGGTRSPP